MRKTLNFTNGSDRFKVRNDLLLEDLDGSIQGLDLVEALPDQEVLGLGRVAEALVDVPEHDRRLLHHTESVGLVHLHQEARVDVGVGVLAPANSVT